MVSNKITYRSQINQKRDKNSNKTNENKDLDFMNRISDKIGDNNNKKDLFLKCVWNIQIIENSPKSTNEKTELDATVTKVLLANGFEENDITQIIALAKHKYWFGTFYTRSIFDLLTDLNFNEIDNSSDAYYKGFGLYLSGAKLESANLSGANLSGAILSDANLSDADLSGANLSGADLGDANLSGANLIGANLIGAKRLSDANLTNALLNNADLRGARLICQKLSGANLSGADLRGANLSGADLRGATLSGANLRGANLSGADLRGANLSGADLSGAKFYRRKHRYETNFADVIFDDNKISIELNIEDLNEGEESSLDNAFNHIANNGHSLLATINSIDNKYPKNKLKLMQNIIEQINKFKPETKKNILRFSNSFSDILCKNAIYHDNKIIKEFIIDNLFLPEIVHADKNLIEFNEAKLILYSKITLDMALNEFCSIHSGFINQLLYGLKKSENKELYKKAFEIEEKYLASIPNDFKTKIMNELNQLYLENVFDEDNTVLKNYFLLASNTTEKTYLLVDYLYYEKFMLNKEEKGNPREWANGTHYTKNSSNEIQASNSLDNFEKLFSEFKLFQANYLFDQSLQKRTKFISLLKLSKDDKSLFLNLLKTNESTEKYIENSRNRDLIKSLNHLFHPIKDIKKTDIELIKQNEENGVKDYNSKLSPEFILNILNIYNENPLDEKQKSQLFLSLSAFFCKLSSSSMLGTETDSPSVIRVLALCFLNLAYETDKSIFNNIQLLDWQQRLDGQRFSCTSILFILMKDKLKDNIYFKQMIPPAWL